MRLAHIGELDQRIAQMEREGLSLEGERRLSLLKRQRTSFIELAENRATLAQWSYNGGEGIALAVER